MRHLVYGVLLASLTLTGCAHRRVAPVRPVATPAAQPSPPSSFIDGTYLGPSRLMQANGKGCPKSTVRSVLVFDRAFDLTYRPAGHWSSPPIHITINPDGSVHAADGDVMIEGRLEGSILNLTVGNGGCLTHMVLRRR